MGICLSNLNSTDFYKSNVIDSKQPFTCHLHIRFTYIVRVPCRVLWALLGLNNHIGQKHHQQVQRTDKPPAEPPEDVRSFPSHEEDVVTKAVQSE